MRRRPGWTLIKVAFRVALMLMTASLFLCRDVASPTAMAAVPLGLPIPFVELDARRRASGPYPRCVRFGDPRVEPTRLRPLAALADLALLSAALLGGAGLLGVGWRDGRAAEGRGRDRDAADGD